MHFECKYIIDKIQAYSIDNFKDRNIETHCVSPELLLIWLCKNPLVTQTTTTRPNYKVYGWIDAGYTTYAKNKHVIPAKPFPTNNIGSVNMSVLYVNKQIRACHPYYHEETTNTTACPIGGWFCASKNIMNAFIKQLYTFS